MTGVTPDYFDSSDGAGDSFDAVDLRASPISRRSRACSSPSRTWSSPTASSRPRAATRIFQAYSLDSANPDQINSRGGYTVAGDPPIGPPDTPDTGDDTHNGGRVLHDGDINPDIIEVDFTGFATRLRPGSARMPRWATISATSPASSISISPTANCSSPTLIRARFVNGVPERETTALGDDDRALTVATFNVENLDPGDGAARFTAHRQRDRQQPQLARHHLDRGDAGQ